MQPVENQRLIELRKRLNISQEQMAKDLDVAQTTISGIEKIDNPNPVSKKMIRLIKKVYAVDLETSSEPVTYIEHITRKEEVVGEKTPEYTPESKPNVYIVPERAYGGFMSGYADGDFLNKLEKIYFPMIKGRGFIFHVHGYSMVNEIDPKFSFEPGDSVLCSDRVMPADLRAKKAYVFATVEGIIIKMFKEIKNDFMYLYSLNPEYQVRPIPMKEVKVILPVVMIQKPVQ